jgi:hypothetical protein
LKRAATEPILGVFFALLKTTKEATMSLPEFIIAVFLEVDELMRSLPCARLRQRGPAPKLRDSEVLTMEIVGEFLGIDTEVGLWRFFREHYLAWFPTLGSRSSFIKQMANLGQVKHELIRRLAWRMGAYQDPIHIVDGLPIPVCHFARAHFSRCFQGHAQYGYCASKKQRYYGFKGHLNISLHGVICGFVLSPANASERDALWQLSEHTHGLYLGDKGYLGEDLHAQLKQHAQIDLQTPLRGNMPENRPYGFVQAMMKTRRKVETVLSQLTERLHLNLVRARNFWHLCSRVARKLLTHSLATWLRDRGGPDSLDFEALLQS